MPWGDPVNSAWEDFVGCRFRSRYHTQRKGLNPNSVRLQRLLLGFEMDEGQEDTLTNVGRVEVSSC